MRFLWFAVLWTATAAASGAAEFDVAAHYDKAEATIPMRDGVKLFVAIYTPKQANGPLPILLTRTPYGVGPYGASHFPKRLAPTVLLEEQFIFVAQDVRGRYMSEGEFVDMPPIKDRLGPNETDETTDAYDTIDWLVKNVANNNGKVGVFGTSYNGFFTTCALIRSHPALAAASPQAPMADLYRGDDAYHNGAFFLIANFSFYTGFPKQNNPTSDGSVPDFDYGSNDAYKFYLQMGALENSDKLYLLNKNAYWTDMYRHTTEDGFWKARNILPHLRDIKPAVLIVGGWYDAEDLAGTLNTYQAIRTQSPKTDCRLAMGPWSHGGWNYLKGDKLGEVEFGSNTAEAVRDLELRFFKQHLKGEEPAQPIPQAFVFETGANQWHALAQWPPADTTVRKLYFAAGEKLAARAPLPAGAFDEYISDPADPVPYFATPSLEMAKQYMIADQRFVAGRKDVLKFSTEVLSTPLIMAGGVAPRLFVSTTASDSDFDVKLIDVHPTGFQELVRGEPFRGKFRKSFEQPTAFQPNAVEEIRFNMPDVYHAFLPGHRVMVQIQSSWFPLTDLNPQTFGDIPSAKPDDFVKATERIWRARGAASNIEFHVEKPETPGTR